MPTSAVSSAEKIAGLGVEDLALGDFLVVHVDRAGTALAGSAARVGELEADRRLAGGDLLRSPMMELRCSPRKL
jgi:hypothetical protein